MRTGTSCLPAVAGSALLLLGLLGPAVAFLPPPQLGGGSAVALPSTAGPALGRAGVTVLDAKKKSKGKAPVTAEQVDDFPSLITEEEEQAAAAEAAGAGSGELSPTMYDKLRSEATTPFRSFRMFVYAGFGVGASLGGFTAINELIASLNHLNNALPVDKAALNVGVDVAVAAASAYAWFFENRLKKETEKEMAQLRAKEPYKLTFDVKAEREKALSDLPVTFCVGENQTFTWTVEEVRKRGNQHLIVLAAPRQELSDALLGARIAKALFAKNDVMIAPFVLKDGREEEKEDEAAKKGFGKPQAPGVSLEAAFSTQNYVAMPADEDGWRAYVEQELNDAIKQGNDNARTQGIGVVMRKDGTIIRRGIGQPEWRDVVAELVGSKKPGENDDSYLSALPIAKQQQQQQQQSKKKK